jgi:hypothetical protein|nr:MAG TPA: hypothetical protein [Caudoviricetes sp.]
MSKKDAINVAFYQSILYLIIGMILGFMDWKEHRYILMLIVVALTIGAQFIASYSLKELDNAVQHNHKKER